MLKAIWFQMNIESIQPTHRVSMIGGKWQIIEMLALSLSNSYYATERAVGRRDRRCFGHNLAEILTETSPTQAL